MNLIPDAAYVAAIEVGVLAPTSLGTMRKVVEVFGRGVDLKGQPFVCYHHEFGPTSTISMSLKAGEAIPTIGGYFQQP